MGPPGEPSSVPGTTIGAAAAPEGDAVGLGACAAPVGVFAGDAVDREADVAVGFGVAPVLEVGAEVGDGVTTGVGVGFGVGVGVGFGVGVGVGFGVGVGVGFGVGVGVGTGVGVGVGTGVGVGAVTMIAG